MKKEILIIANHQSDSSPFVEDLIKFSSLKFHKVYYVTRESNRKIELTIDSNIYFSTLNFKSKIIAILKMFLGFFSVKNFKNMKIAFSNRKFSLKFLVFTLQQLYRSSLYYIVMKQIVRKNRNNEISILSAWFWTESLAIAKIKKKYRNVKATSLVHAFEVDDYRNDYSLLFFNEFRHKFIDQLIFISKNKLEYYNLITKKMFNLDKITTRINYLGTFREGENLTKISTDNIIRIVSCSTVNKVKRINLIIDGISTWDKSNIEWTHIGAGPLLKEIKNYAKEKLDHLDNVAYNFKGFVDNSEILKIYLKNQIDFFINVSSTEGIPVSIMEALSCGIPVIATDVGGVTEIVNEENGFIITSNFTNRELHVIFKTYLAMDNDNRNKLKKQAFNSWNKEFNAENNYTKLIKSLKKNEKIGDE